MNNNNHIKYHRRETNTVVIGGVALGSEYPVRVQTMCNTPTQNIEASVVQCKKVADAGADYVRLTTQGLKEVEALAEIKRQLRRDGYNIPLIADVHFNANVAIAAAAIADKVRINPGNFAGTPVEMEEKLLELFRVCRQHKTALRVGVNHGSLSERIMSAFGDTPAGMVESAMEMLRICQREDFTQVVVSMKSSNTRVMVAAYRLLVECLETETMGYPLHLGVTEAGDGYEGRIKSAVGIGTLLTEGYGDTIRISLTEPPENEIPVAQELVRVAPLYPYNPKMPHEKVKQLVRDYKVTDTQTLILQAACDSGPLLLDGFADDLLIFAVVAGKVVPDEKSAALARILLQATRVRFSMPEYIACPGCGRTLFDLQGTLAEVRKATSAQVGLKIAVMGCIVNGPGEMADADYGYVGAGHEKVTLYKGKTAVKKNIPQEKAVEELVKLIKDSGDWKE